MARSARPSTLIISRRRFCPTLCRCCGFEFEDVIAAITSADVLAPVPAAPFSPLLQRLLRKPQRWTGLRLERAPRAEPCTVEQDYELCFVLVQTPADLRMLDSVRGWRRRATVAVCWIEELWAVGLDDERKLEPLKAFDHVFLNCSATVEPLAERLGVPCHFAPPAVDALRFCPYPDPPARCIDVFGMGRRSAVTHAALLDAARRRGLFYLHDTTGPSLVLDPCQHRAMLAAKIQRSRYFLINKAKVDSPRERGDQEEIGFRFFEGAAAGAVLIGDPPNAAAFEQCFGWPDAVIHLPFDAPHPGELIAELDAQPERLARIRMQNVVQSLLRHDWAHRWQQILDAVGREPEIALQQRRTRLQELADLVSSQPAVASTPPPCS